MPGLNTLRITDGTSGSRGSEGDQTPARMPCDAHKREAGSGGRFKCVSGRQSARTRRRVDKSDNSWGHAADRSNPSRAERRRLPASVAGCSNKQPRRLLLPRSSGCPVPHGAGRHVLHRRVATHGAAGAAKRPAFRTPLRGPRKAKKAKEVRLAPGRAKNRGDESRLHASGGQGCWAAIEESAITHELSPSSRGALATKQSSLRQTRMLRFLLRASRAGLLRHRRATRRRSSNGYGSQ